MTNLNPSGMSTPRPSFASSEMGHPAAEYHCRSTRSITFGGG
eukprot:CAMPEP_0204299178 /NCGR_PEP_ID=MMETSP0468-20130131/76323_1 /ASSEMBLY_ACC=CAM_ASM_000383 /TAXON_ID=2969 /ORGANISM="Oxyrrhis marina" /LENGTH=41 /DNA_ID= /DNA_START= /DNA_END= /DNA_ORIENTATION=